MPTNCGNCKANPVDIARNTHGTPTAKLIAILIAHGITDNKQIAEATGLSLRAIQHARATHCAQPIASDSATHCVEAQPIAQETQPIAPSRADSINNITTTQSQITTVGVCNSGRRKPRSLGSRLPVDWLLPKSWGEWAQINTQLDRQGILAEADKFRDFWIAKTGANATKLDWEATWRNWCRSASERRPYSPQRMAHDERKARLAAEGKPATVREALALRIRQREEATNAAA